METHYHSQFDNDEYYDPQVYQFHHELYALLILAIDATAGSTTFLYRCYETRTGRSGTGKILWKTAVWKKNTKQSANY